MPEKKYYTAYDNRYRQVHKQNLQWFNESPSPIVAETIHDFMISRQHKILEIGCGEGRDAHPLFAQGFDLLATDVSPEAISFCQKQMPDYTEHFQLLDCVTEKLNDTFDFIYAIAVVHMLVLDADRNAFYSFIREHLKSDGIALICTMGDGNMECQSDIQTAFSIQNRIHQQTGKKIQIANTSCRMVSFQTFEKELERNGLAIIKQGVTAIEPDFPQIMFAVVKPAPKWKVYFEGNFWGHQPGQRPGTEISLGTQFEWADRHWVIPAAYSCSKGLVVDFCIQIEPWLIEAFMKKWDLTMENEAYKHFSKEERMHMELDNPMSLNFDAVLCLNGKELHSTHGCGCMWNPYLPAHEEYEGKWAAKHYGLDQNFGWMIWRSCYPWATRRKSKIKSLSMTISQQKISIPGPHFRVEKPGDVFLFTYPENGTEYILTVQEYEAQCMDFDRMSPQDMDYPTHYYAMTYTLTPEMPDGMMSLVDCDDGNRPRQRHQPKDGPTSVHAAAVIGIIGGAGGPTAISHGQNSEQSKLHVACSSLHFEPVTDIEWRMVFHEKQYEDMALNMQI